ncbi:hypothetical protein DFJ73DRAFT_764483 [Zopfochytrium polystomum]|nr:hypothetical protein DFJ73DRAFT_764483 [Zopfochytrium polystomum]
MHKDSEPIWDYGYRDPQITSTTTAAADYSVKRVDPRARPQRRIIFGSFGAGEDHVRFLNFRTRTLCLRGGQRSRAAAVRRLLGKAVLVAVFEDRESIRLTSTHKKHFAAGGFVLDSSLSAAAAGKPAGLPTPKSEALFTVASSTLLDTIKAAQRR